MFDWLRRVTQSAEMGRQERVNDYVDDTLSAEARKRFEAELLNDASLAQEVAELRSVKAALNTLPRQPVPRNFTLDPALYNKPERAWDVQFYPALQAATALSAIVFVIFATLSLLPAGDNMEMASAPVAMVEQMAEEAAAEPRIDLFDEEAAFDEAVAKGSDVSAARQIDLESRETMSTGEVLQELAVVVETVAENGEFVEMMSEEEAPEVMMADEGAADEAMAEAASAPSIASAPANASEEIIENEVASDSAEDTSDSASASASSAVELMVTASPASQATASPTQLPTTIASPTQQLATTATDADMSAPLEIEVTVVVVSEVAEVISAESGDDPQATALADNMVEEGVFELEQPGGIRPIAIWALALLTLFLLLLYLTLRTRSRL